MGAVDGHRTGCERVPLTTGNVTLPSCARAASGIAAGKRQPAKNPAKNNAISRLFPIIAIFN
jgi:hypothetical protein